jgi:ClpP class serine protease
MKLHFELESQMANTEKTLSDMRNMDSIKQESFLDLFFTARKPLTIDENGIATIHVSGSLADSAPPIWERIGNTSYATIRNEIDAARENGAKAILFHVDSGGGEASGLESLANAIQAVGVPTIAYCHSLACSAAYWIATATMGIVARVDASVGNIGSIIVAYDDSAMLEKYGVKRLVFTNDGATLNATGYEYDDEKSGFLQDIVNKSGERFWQFVSENRPVSDICKKAGWYESPESMEYGLVDYYVDDADEAKKYLLD